ncbi:MAG: HD domain-containing protein [Candidatus Abawacabacteria bacterium]|nr:HD domain-containing protein [Candidatus Abawacabacteria bacterium]
MQSMVHFLFEMGLLARTPRSGLWYLGTGKQSVAEHINRVSYIGLTLAKMEGDVDVAKVMQMCLLHDISEVRTADLNYTHQKYVKVDEEKALKDLTDTLPFGDYIQEVLHEYHARVTKESILAKDADNLELLLTLKEQLDWGNSRAGERHWLHTTAVRVKSDSAKKLAEKIMATHADNWYVSKIKEEWFINRTSDDQT